jgi:hypothetical protein
VVLYDCIFFILCDRSRAEDSANNLKTYSSMVVACEYLLSYYGDNYRGGWSVFVDLLLRCAAATDDVCKC